MDADFEAQLASIGQVANQKDRIKGYQDLLTSILQSTPAADDATTSLRLEQFVTAATDESVGLVVSRQALTDFTSAVDAATNLSAENKKRVYKHALDKVHGRVVSFEEQASFLHLALHISVRDRNCIASRIHVKWRPTYKSSGETRAEI